MQNIFDLRRGFSFGGSAVSARNLPQLHLRGSSRGMLGGTREVINQINDARGTFQTRGRSLQGITVSPTISPTSLNPGITVSPATDRTEDSTGPLFILILIGLFAMCIVSNRCRTTESLKSLYSRWRHNSSFNALHGRIAVAQVAAPPRDTDVVVVDLDVITFSSTPTLPAADSTENLQAMHSPESPPSHTSPFSSSSYLSIVSASVSTIGERDIEPSRASFTDPENRETTFPGGQNDSRASDTRGNLEQESGLVAGDSAEAAAASAVAVSLSLQHPIARPPRQAPTVPSDSTGDDGERKMQATDEVPTATARPVNIDHTAAEFTSPPLSPSLSSSSSLVTLSSTASHSAVAGAPSGQIGTQPPRRRYVSGVINRLYGLEGDANQRARQFADPTTSVSTSVSVEQRDSMPAAQAAPSSLPREEGERAIGAVGEAIAEQHIREAGVNSRRWGLGLGRHIGGRTRDDAAASGGNVYRTETRSRTGITTTTTTTTTAEAVRAAVIAEPLPSRLAGGYSYVAAERIS